MNAYGTEAARSTFYAYFICTRRCATLAGQINEKTRACANAAIRYDDLKMGHLYQRGKPQGFVNVPALRVNCQHKGQQVVVTPNWLNGGNFRNYPLRIARHDGARKTDVKEIDCYRGSAGVKRGGK